MGITSREVNVYLSVEERVEILERRIDSLELKTEKKFVEHLKMFTKLQKGLINVIKILNGKGGLKREMDIYIGIDPGATGAIAFVNKNVLKIFDFEDIGYMEVLRNISLNGKGIALIEKQQAFEKQGAVSAFSLGMNYGGWLKMLEALCIPFETVMPLVWKKEIYDVMPSTKPFKKIEGESAKDVKKRKDKSQGERKKALKAKSLEMARRLFPKITASHLARKKDHDRAEALLLAEVCRRRHETADIGIDPLA